MVREGKHNRGIYIEDKMESPSASQPINLTGRVRPNGDHTSVRRKNVDK